MLLGQDTSTWVSRNKHCLATGEGAPVAILNRNEPAFYCVPARAYEALLNRLEDLELNAIADARQGQAEIEVSLDDL